MRVRGGFDFGFFKKHLSRGAFPVCCRLNSGKRASPVRALSSMARRGRVSGYAPGGEWVAGTSVKGPTIVRNVTEGVVSSDNVTYTYYAVLKTR